MIFMKQMFGWENSMEFFFDNLNIVFVEALCNFV